MNIRKLSIIIPAYNEANTIAQILYGVVNAPLPSGIEKEIIIIDDCSTDNTALQVRKVQQSNPNAHIIRAQEIFYPKSETSLYKCGVRNYLCAGK